MKVNNSNNDPNVLSFQ